MARKFRKRRKTKRESVYNQPFKLSADLIVQQNATGGIDLNLHYRSLTRFISSVSQTAGLVNASKMKDLYDEFKPVGTRVTWIPTFSSTQAPNSGFVGTGRPVQMVVAHDPDNTGFADPRSMLAHRGSSIFASNERWSRYYKHATFSNTQATKGYQNLQNESLAEAQSGIIGIATVAAAVPQQPELPMGILRITHYIRVKGRNDANPTSYYGVDDFGNTLLAPPVYVVPANVDGDENQQTGALPSI